MNLHFKTSAKGVPTYFQESIWKGLIEQMICQYGELQNQKLPKAFDKELIDSKEINAKLHTLRKFPEKWNVKPHEMKIGKWYWLRFAETMPVLINVFDIVIKDDLYTVHFSMNGNVYKKSISHFNEFEITKARYFPGKKFKPCYWSGRPYHSSPVVFAPELTIVDVRYVGVTIADEDIVGIVMNEFGVLNKQETIDFIANEGFTDIKDFSEWFKGGFEGQYICWGSVNYGGRETALKDNYNRWEQNGVPMCTVGELEAYEKGDRVIRMNRWQQEIGRVFRQSEPCNWNPDEPLPFELGMNPDPDRATNYTDEPTPINSVKGLIDNYTNVNPDYEYHADHIVKNILGLNCDSIAAKNVLESVDDIEDGANMIRNLYNARIEKEWEIVHYLKSLLNPLPPFFYSSDPDTKDREPIIDTGYKDLSDEQFEDALHYASKQNLVWVDNEQKQNIGNNRLYALVSHGIIENIVSKDELLYIYESLQVAAKQLNIYVASFDSLMKDACKPERHALARVLSSIRKLKPVIHED